MKLESHLPRQSPWLYIAPFLTAMLLILIYFLLSSGFVVRSGVTIKSPESSSRLVGFESAHIVTLAPGDPVRVFFDGRSVSPTELGTLLDGLPHSNRHILIQADRRVPFGQVMEVSQVVLRRHFEVAYATNLPSSGGAIP